MGVFENGWICRQCWSSNRENDLRCYRCHTERPNYGLPRDEPIKAAPVPSAPQPVVLAAQPAAPTPAPATKAAEVAASTITCAHCGEQIAAGSRFCTRCGEPVNAASTSVAPWRRLLRATGPEATSPAPTQEIAEEPQPVPQPVAAVVAAKAVPGVSLRQRISAAVAKRFEWLQAFAPRRVFGPRIEWVRGRIEQLRSVQDRPTVTLFAAWGILWIASGALLYVYAGGELLIGMLVVLTLCVLSALTAALTVILLGPRRRMLNELADQMRVLSSRTSGEEGTGAQPSRVMPQIRTQPVKKAS